MLTCVVNSRLHLSFPPLFIATLLSLPLTPLESALTHFGPVTLLESALTKNTGVYPPIGKTNTEEQP